LKVERKRFGEERMDRESGRLSGAGEGGRGVDMEIDFIVSEPGKQPESGKKVAELVAGYSFILVKVIGKVGVRGKEVLRFVSDSSCESF
jgi:hypothetical protein